MAIGAGRLDRKITIERATYAANALNEQIPSWGTFISVRARKRDLSDGERVEAGQVSAALISRFVIRSSDDARTVTPNDRLTYGGATWNIQGVKEAEEGRDRFIEITAARAAD